MLEKSISRFEQSPEHFLWYVDQGVATITLKSTGTKLSLNLLILCKNSGSF